jgi:hypothetical protein
MWLSFKKKQKEKEEVNNGNTEEKVKIIVTCIAVIFAAGISYGFLSGERMLTLSRFSSGDSILYMNVTSSNLPVSAASGNGMDVECADVDNDGDLDILIANEYTPNKLMLNNGSGVFTDGTPGRLPAKNLDSEDIAIADFDNDGDLDVVFATEDHRVHEYYLNNGSGSFMTDVSSRLPQSTANSVLAEDINNDSIPDLVFGNANPNDTPGQNFILINNGDGTFRDETYQRLDTVLDVTQDIKMGDLDGDGDKDMVVGNEDGNKLYLNNGSGFFTDSTASRLPLTGTEETRKVTLDDVDEDGDLDIYFANVDFGPATGSRQDRLLMNNGLGAFIDETSSRLPFDGEHTLEGLFLDYDFDGDKDLFTGLGFTSRAIQVFENNGSEIFTEVFDRVIPPGLAGNCLGMRIADYNRDNLQDIYFVIRQGTHILLYRNDTAAVGINPGINNIPAEVKLYQNYPNPFNPGTVINYDVSKREFVKLDVVDASGRVIAVLENGVKNAGSYSVNFNSAGYNLASGIYFYRLNIGRMFFTKKMLLIK